MKFILTICSLFLFQHMGMAQGSDYIIDVSDRKIYGTIKLNTPAINSSRIGFKDNKSGVVQHYRPDQVKTWATGDLLYEAKVYSINNRKAFSVFMRRLTPEGGKCNLYEYYNTSGDMGYTQTFLERDQVMTEVNYSRFRKEMTEYFKDNKELSEKIANKEYKKKDLIDIIEAYNEWREYMWR